MMKNGQDSGNGRAGGFLGIEAGATHTACLLTDGDGRELLRFDLGQGNVRLTSDADLLKLFQSIKERTGSPASIAAGMAGLRNDADHRRVLGLARMVWPHEALYLTNDLETPMMAAGPLPDWAEARVLLLSGTGSCAFGVDRKGRTMKFGGRGHILGDQGSACDIALAALRRIVYQHDLKAEFPPLGRAVLRALQLNDPDDLIPWTQVAEKQDIANLAVTIFQESLKGDSLAGEIIAHAAEKLADMALHCAEHLLGHARRVQFIFNGSVLLKQPAFSATVSRRIHELWPRCRIQRLRRESVWGAVEIAKANIEHQTSNSEHRRQMKEGDAASEFDVGSSKFNVQRSSEIVPLSLLAKSPTEQRNPRTRQIDSLPLDEAVELMLAEDSTVPAAVLQAKAGIVWTVEKIIAAFANGGRLFYVGAGTSGRLGILDASECPPTFRVSPDQVQGIIAGGRRAIWSAVEGAEDDSAAGASTVRARGVQSGDVLVGIAASGRTPFVWGALQEARKLGAVTVLLCFNPMIKVKKEDEPDRMILINTGPEVLTGSTRLKAGTATKLVLNIFTTLAMIRSGKAVSNLMVDMNPSNVKLRDRAERMLQELTGCDLKTAHQALKQTGWRVKNAYEQIVAIRSKVGD